MAETDRGDITCALNELKKGDRTAIDRALPLIYAELRALAGSYFKRQRDDHTLQPTALVHEAFLRLLGKTSPGWNNRKHFFDVAAMAMRQLLTDYARSHGAAKRGGDWARVTLGDVAGGSSLVDLDLFALDAALTKLKTLDERQSRIVELRFLAGLTVEETAEVLDISPRTVKLDWHMAKSWLRRHLTDEES